MPAVALDDARVAAVLARIASSLKVVDAHGVKHDVGLGIKSRAQRLVAVGWVRLRSNALSDAHRAA